MNVSEIEREKKMSSFKGGTEFERPAYLPNRKNTGEGCCLHSHQDAGMSS